MLELAEDEQQDFINEMVEKATQGVTSSQTPTFYALLGAPGSGKSTLARHMNNAVKISTDSIIAEYARTLGYDIREDFYDSEISLFAAKVSHEIYKTAIKNKMNIVYDSSALHNTLKMLEHTSKFGYQAQIKVMLADEYEAAMNVVERKMDIDEAYTKHRELREKFGYPTGNPMAVKPNVSLNASAAIQNFVMEAVEKGYPIEIYEFGKQEPSYKSGDDFDKFIANVKLIPIEQHIARCDKLKARADAAGREDDVLNLLALKREMMGRR